MKRNTNDWDFPSTEQVVSLYNRIEEAHARGQLAATARESFLGAAASAETRKQLLEVEQQFEGAVA